MSKVDDVSDSFARNVRLRHYDINIVMVPHEHARRLNRKYFEQKAAISADRRLTNEGKDAAIREARANRDQAINEWHEGRVKNIDADLLQQRAALITQTETPDPRRVEVMAEMMRKHDLSDLPVFYGSATEPERRLMEAASALTGRVPVKSTDGKKWKPLLDPEMVNESIMARAEVTNPEAAQKVRELTEIKAMQTTITRVVLSES